MKSNSAYAELHCLSNYSFLRGASHPHELIQQAKEQGYKAVALTDECSLAGIVQAYDAAEELDIHLIIGTEISLIDGPKLVLLAPDKTAYSQICRLITQGRRAAEKGRYTLYATDLEGAACNHCLAILLTPYGDLAPSIASTQWLANVFSTRAWIAVELHRDADDEERLQQLRKLSRHAQIPLVACGDVHMHQRSRRLLQDTMTAIRHRCTLTKAGSRLFPNGERHLRNPSSLQQIYPPDLLYETLRVARRCRFSLQQLQYNYPAEVPTGCSPLQHLRNLTAQGLQKRWPEGTPAAVDQLIEKELGIIEQLDCAQYFLTVHAIMQWARKQNIFCQGRGSAGNSAVCFALGITVVDPSKQALLFERFLSPERNEPPDIDVDFEHQRREEVFQYIYQKYDRKHAALAATVIRYRPKSAIRDVGKALGLSVENVTQISQSLAWWDKPNELPERLQSLGFDPQSKTIQQLFALLPQILDMPRHLSQHVGGFVICETPLQDLVPIENAAMPERTVIQWEKRDLERVGLFKIDCLALGMLTAIHRSFDVIAQQYGQNLSIASVLKSAESADQTQAEAVFNMLGRGQSVGVFQIESRAQMSMLPRLKPRSLYDLTVEVAIVRPGPIQGGMVHPYLERHEYARQHPEETFDCPAALRDILGRTYGIPIFQEQVMEVCVQGAGFAPGEANQVRRSMAAWGRSGYGKLAAFEKRLKQGFRNNGIGEEFADQIFQQIQGFSEYGFPESHAASFASLAYVSSWLKRFYPAAFLCGLINSQPMGFYTPSQLIQDFRRTHSVRCLPPDVQSSTWLSRLEQNNGQLAVRLGLHLIKGLSQACGEALAADAPYKDPTELFQRSKISQKERTALARADALRTLAGSRHQAHWAAQDIHTQGDTLPKPCESPTRLCEPLETSDVIEDYASLDLSLRRHPVAFLREQLTRHKILSARQWRDKRHGSYCRVAGIVTNRQRPGTAKGIIFMTLEDETGTINLIVSKQVLETQRKEVLQAPFIIAEGLMQNQKNVRHLKVSRLHDRSHWVQRLNLKSRNFH